MFRIERNMQTSINLREAVSCVFQPFVGIDDDAFRSTSFFLIFQDERKYIFSDANLGLDYRNAGQFP